jgi:hypothetical protein
LALQASPGRLELAIGGRQFRIWFYRTDDGMADVLSEGYFDTCWERGMRLHDRLLVVALATDPDGAEYEDFVVVGDKCSPREGTHICVAELRR